MPDLEPQPMMVGDHLALDFLNSRVSDNSVFEDWMDGDQGLLNWLLKAEVIDEEVLAQVKMNQKQRDSLTKQARELREWLADYVSRLLEGTASKHINADTNFINSLLVKDNCYSHIEISDKTTSGAHNCSIHNQRHWQTPDSLLQPIINAIADLMCNVNASLVKRCEANDCILAFYDRTKAHKRRWCSMAICGNRAKAAANRARKAKYKEAGGS